MSAINIFTRERQLLTYICSLEGLCLLLENPFFYLTQEKLTTGNVLVVELVILKGLIKSELTHFHSAACLYPQSRHISMFESLVKSQALQSEIMTANLKLHNKMRVGAVLQGLNKTNV